MAKLRFVADIMSSRRRNACVQALEKFWGSGRRRKDWPGSDHVDLEDVDLIVLPLERVGAPPGESGASVFVAYYCVRDGSARIKPSPPFAVKIHTKKEMERERKDADRLPTLEPTRENRFAKPIDCYPIDDDLAVLIAPFGSVYSPGEPQKVTLNDLWTALKEADRLTGSDYDDAWRKIERHVGSALDLVGGLHRGTGSERQTRSYREALSWYVRHTRDPACSEKSRAHVPHHIFGDEPTVCAFGRRWVNPTRVIDRLLPRTFETTTGAVHGDLHPKNVVLDDADRPHIIDFGWACTNAAVVVDYALLDINIRSITLPSQIDQWDVLKIAEFLPGGRKPTKLRKAVQRRVDLIHGVIWDRVEEQGVIQDWGTEYVIPFFIVAYGLLVHLDKARNQMALVATVLAAAEHIDDETRRE